MYTSIYHTSHITTVSTYQRILMSTMPPSAIDTPTHSWGCTSTSTSTVRRLSNKLLRGSDFASGADKYDCTRQELIHRHQ